jgi:hypothetical protein
MPDDYDNDNDNDNDNDKRQRQGNEAASAGFAPPSAQG